MNRSGKRSGSFRLKAKNKRITFLCFVSSVVLCIVYQIRAVMEDQEHHVFKKFKVLFWEAS